MNGNVECPGCGLHFEFVLEEDDHYDLTQDISDDESAPIQKTTPPGGAVSSKEDKDSTAEGTPQILCTKKNARKSRSQWTSSSASFISKHGDRDQGN